MRLFIACFWNRRERRLRSAWRLLLNLIFTVVMLLAMVIVTVGLLGAPDDGQLFLIAGGLAQSVVILAAVLFCCRWPDRRQIRGIGFESFDWRDLRFGLILGAVMMLGIFAVEYTAGRIEIVRIGRPAEVGWANWVTLHCAWLVLMVFVGVAEEALSRGYHLKNIAEGMSSLGMIGSLVVAGVASSAVFGLLHAFNENATTISTASVIAAGALLVVVRLVTGSLAAPIGLHITWNYFQGAQLGFPVSGNAIPSAMLEIRHDGPAWITGGDFGPEAGVLGWVACFLGVAIVVARIRLKNSHASRKLLSNALEIVKYRRSVV